ncbi:hypothetical protein [Marinobacter sp.]|uniref:hypothetical protein n=1 Tax=Marinobacter sp. TaxID=50741 RepID=UPI003A94E993
MSMQYFSISFFTEPGTLWINAGTHLKYVQGGRRNWQSALLGDLESRNEPGFEEAITELISNPEAARGDAYAEMMSRSTTAMASLIQDLLLASQPSHLDHLTHCISELSGDFKALTCKPGSEVASRAFKQSDR